MELAVTTPGLTVAEFEREVGLSPKMGYHLIKTGKVKAYRNSAGQLRVHPLESYLYLREQEDN